MNKVTAQVFDLAEERQREKASRYPWNAREEWNNAYIHGKACTEFDALMNREAAFIVKDWGRRSIPVRGWNSKSKKLADWFEDWLTWHREDQQKSGAGFVFGVSANGERKAESMRQMAAIGLDIEPEQSLDDVVDLCEASGLALVLYTSYNFDRTTDFAPVDAVLKHGDEVSTETIRAYLRAKGAYTEEFISRCSLRNPRADFGGRIQAEWSCPPLQKMRVVAFFSEPVDVTSLNPSPKKGQEIWSNKVRGLAKLLGVRIDPVAVDPSRILYVAKHRPNAEWYCAIFRGRPVRWDEIPDVEKGVENAFLEAGVKNGRAVIPDVTTRCGVNVTELYRRFGKRWLLADMLADSHVAKSEGSDRLHVVCPFVDDHTSESGLTSTTVWNAGETEYGFAKVICQHSCKERYHTVEYVARWVEEGVIEPAWLEQGAYMIDAPDQAGPFEQLTSEELAEEKAAQIDRVGNFETLVSGFSSDATDAEIRAFMKEVHGNVDRSARNRISEQLAENTALGKRDINRVWKELDNQSQRRVQAKTKSPAGIEITAPAPDLTKYAKDSVNSANDKDPFLFEYMERAAIVQNGRVKLLDRAGRRHELGKVTVFQKLRGEGELQHVYPPYDVVDDLFSTDLSEFCLPLLSVVDTPFFAACGTLVTENGYHAGSKVYLDCGLKLESVSSHPTFEEAQAATRYIVEECLADFPLGGLSREEMMARVFTTGVPAVANTLALILLQFARNMIHGATPGHVVNKPAPGTGAGFLVDVCTTIRSGVPAPALPMPTRKEELGKTLFSVLLDGEPAVFFDNINHEMDSAELAAAMTPPETGYRARILGRSETALVRVMSSWIFAANTLTMSAELLRRCILIDLDRKAVDPAKYVPQEGWRHKDVRRWTRENRGKLVHACLTIIQHWVAEGMQRSDATLASFENWAGVMGGILEAVGVVGFMGNQTELTGLSDGRDDELTAVVQAIASAMFENENARLYIGSRSDSDTIRGKLGLFDILHSMEDTPRLDQWGYEVDRVSGEVRYSNTHKVGRRFKAAATRIYRVQISGVAYAASFVQEHDSSANVKCYRLDLSAA